MFRRLVAYGIDWYLVLLGMNTLLVVTAYVMTGDLYVGSLPLVYFEPGAQLILLAVLMIIEALYYCAFPRYLLDGQTVGKRLMHVRIRCVDGSPAGFVRLAVRDLLGTVMLEGCFSPLSNYLRNAIMTFGNRDMVQYLIWASWITGVVSILIMLVTKDHRMLHDLVAGTRVENDSPCMEEPGEGSVPDGYPIDGTIEQPHGVRDAHS